jgi:type VI secretion system protein VasJ
MDVISLGKEPIGGDHRAGIDVRYEPEFEVLQAEIDKIGSPTASGQVDWKSIVEKAANILKTRSKDLTVASYLAVGLVHTRHVEGLDQGVQVLRDLVETFWEDLYPPKKRMRGRQGALGWWLEKTESELQKAPPAKPLPAELVQRIRDNLQAVDQQLAEKMEDPPLVRPIQRIVERFEVVPQSPAQPAADQPKSAPQVSKPAAAEPSTPVLQPPTPAAKAVTAEAADKITNAQEAGKAADAALQKIRQASAIFLKADYKNPLAYRLRRIAAWARLDALPPHKEGITQIPPPAVQVLDTFSQLREAGNIPAFIENAEQKLSQVVFWVDLNRMVAEALSDLGAGCQKALDVVRQETAGFMSRFAGIEELSFSDGRPFADMETRQWIKGLGTHAGQGADSDSPLRDGLNDTSIKAKLQEARVLARKKQLVDGVNLLQKNMRQSESRCVQMQWRLAIIQLLLSVKKHQLALPHAEQVLQDIESFRLEMWDPGLALEGLNSAWQTFSAQNTNEHKAQAVQLLQRIASIDSVAALRLQP